MSGTTRSGRAFWFSFGVERLGLVALMAPRASALAIVALTILCAFGMQRISVDDSLTELFRTDTEEFRRYEEVTRRFPSSEFDVLVVVEGKSLLTRKSLSALRVMTLDLGFIDGVQGIISIFSAYRPPDEDGNAEPVFPIELPDGAAFEAIIDELRTNEIVKGKFLSDDGELTMVMLSLDPDTVRAAGLKQTIGEMRATVDEQLAGTGLTAFMTGPPVMQLEIRNAVQRDRILYNGLGFLLGAGIALIFFRSLRLTLIAAAGPAAAIVWSLGAIGFLDFELNMFVNVITPLITVNGFSDSMHLVFNIRRDMMAGVDRLTAARNAVKNVAPACFLTALTAAVALGSFMFAKSALIQTFGTAATIAVILAYIAVVVVVPVLAVLLLPAQPRAPEAETSARPDHGMALLGALSERLFAHVARWNGRYLLASIVAVILCGLAYASLEPHYRLADQVPDKEQALTASGKLDQKLTGAIPMHVMIKWTPGPSLYTDEVLGVIAEAHRLVEVAAGLGNVWSLHTLRDWLKRAGDEQIATLERYVSILPPYLVRRFIAPEQDAVLISGRLPDVDASEILPVVDRLDQALEDLRRANPQFEISVTGLPAIAARNSAQMIWELNVGLISDIVVVIVLLGVAFRSVFVSAVSILPSLFPIFATGALLYVTGQGLHFASIIALTVAFGLALDSTIHFLNRYDIERTDPDGRERSASQALIETARMIGPVIILTTIVLALGLGVTILSDLPSLRTFGELSGVTLFAALAAQLIVLPAAVAFGRGLMDRRRTKPVGQAGAGS